MKRRRSTRPTSTANRSGRLVWVTAWLLVAQGWCSTASALTVRWFGQSAFLFTTRAGVTILTDPYQPGAFSGALRYKKIVTQPDIVLVSHEHADHDWIEPFRKSATIVTQPGSREIRGIPIVGIPSVHDANGGRDRGPNTIFCWQADGLRVCHLGDQGAPLTALQLEQMGRVDVLLIPTGGYYTIDAAEAWKMVETVKPRVAIPMHYLTEGLDPAFFPLTGVSAFTKETKRVRTFTGKDVDLKPDTLPRKTEIWILRPTQLP